MKKNIIILFITSLLSLISFSNVFAQKNSNNLVLIPTSTVDYYSYGYKDALNKISYLKSSIYIKLVEDKNYYGKNRYRKGWAEGFCEINKLNSDGTSINSKGGSGGFKGGSGGGSDLLDRLSKYTKGPINFFPEPKINIEEILAEQKRKEEKDRCNL